MDDEPHAVPRYSAIGARSSTTCCRCGVASDDAASEGVPLGWSTSTTTRGVEPLCASCTREHVRDIEAKLDEAWWV